jgi:hypothetical protein
VARRIDRFGRVALKSRSLAALVAAAVWATAASAGADVVVHGAILPSGVSKVGPDRYNAGMSWEYLEKFYDKLYPRSRYERIDIVNQPTVKAVHLRNPDPRGKWEGLNIYEHKGRVKIFVVQRAPGAAPKATAPKKTVPPKAAETPKPAPKPAATN